MDSQEASSKNVRIGRDANVTDGDFVGRDKIVQHIELGDLLEKIAQEKIAAKQKKLLPVLLPYRLDREIQTEEFRSLCSAKEQDCMPLVGIIHGDDKQAHDMFLARLANEIIPEALGLDPLQTSVVRIPVPWPVYLQKISELSESLTYSLAKEILHVSKASCHDMQRTLAAYQSPVMIEMELLTNDWIKHKSGILEAILQFWNDWPALAPRQRLFIFLYVTHKIPNTGWLKRRIYLHHKQEIFAQLLHCAFQHYPRIQGRVFTELNNVTEQEARNWARTVPRDVFDGDVTVLLSKISSLFDGHESLPMEIVAFKLKEFLMSSAGD